MTATPKDFLAHIGDAGEAHLLLEHLEAVAELAGTFATRYGETWARLAGRWHDLGKFRPGFQRYIRQVNGQDAHIEGKLPADSDKTHSAAGALHALAVFGRLHGDAGAHIARVLAYVIAGHHAGLGDWATSPARGGLDKRLHAGALPSQCEFNEATAACAANAPGLLALPPDFDLVAAVTSIPGIRNANPLAWSMWIRMLFSALVDADFLDTERFMNRGRSDIRDRFEPIAWYAARLDDHLNDMSRQVKQEGRQAHTVMRARAVVLQRCRDKAGRPPGVFQLTVPTGGGKTLSSLAFALRHAQAHGKRRVVYAIPYTSIIEQTADVFAGIFGAGAVVEHHSQADVPDRDETAHSRLACENWDAPLVVTTNVQLFESLFAARTSRCRKLHNLVDSVIVLDEAQLLPPEFLQPILDALSLLVAHYGVSVLLCTATQPVLGDIERFDPRHRLRGLPPATRIVEDPAELFAQLRRVSIEWPADLNAAVPLDALVPRMAAEPCVLIIVNTRRDAAELVTALDARTGDRTVHLSAAMCGQHRADVIADIRSRLDARRQGGDARPLRVVSTQLVEAGVDIDFPVVFRSLAGLDSIAQAAGRCNREGLLPEGRVVVFVRKLPKMLTPLLHGAAATRTVLADSPTDALTPAAFERYFPAYYSSFASLDARNIVPDLGDGPTLSFQFRTAADKFRLVDDEDQATLIVSYPGLDGANDAVGALLGRLRNEPANRGLLRRLQRYAVNVRTREVEIWLARGDVAIVQPGLYHLVDTLRYDARLGLAPEGDTLGASAHFI